MPEPKFNQDPAEGSRDIIEHELEREDDGEQGKIPKDQPQDAGPDSKPSDT
jgi:hypothetical protein